YDCSYLNKKSPRKLVPRAFLKTGVNIKTKPRLSSRPSPALQQSTNEVAHRRSYRGKNRRLQHITPVEAVPDRAERAAQCAELHITQRFHRYPPFPRLEPDPIPPAPGRVPSR